MKPIYEPKGKAKEYGDLAINIYTGCPHRCFYCFAPSVKHQNKEQFHTEVKPRDGVVEAVKKQLEREQITDKLIHLCFTCDPYPTGYDTTPTREIIKLIKDSGNHVQILTKGDGTRDFDLLDENDWYGVTIDGALSKFCANTFDRIAAIMQAKERGIRTWISFEPVIRAEAVFGYLDDVAEFVDIVKIGKLNYHPSDIDWAFFGNAIEQRCKFLGVNYYIKDSLREEMNK